MLFKEVRPDCVTVGMAEQPWAKGPRRPVPVKEVDISEKLQEPRPPTILMGVTSLWYFHENHLNCTVSRVKLNPIWRWVKLPMKLPETVGITHPAPSNLYNHPGPRVFGTHPTPHLRTFDEIGYTVPDFFWWFKSVYFKEHRPPSTVDGCEILHLLVDDKHPLKILVRNVS